MSGHFARQLEQLHEEAMAATGLSDFGDPVYLQGLQELLAAYDANGISYPDGGAPVLGQIGQRLMARLHSLNQIQRLDRAVAAPKAPLFILGLPRTGTTAVQRLLMASPDFQGLEYWLGENPRPRPPRADWEGIEDFRRTRDGLAIIGEVAPLVDAMHSMRADEGEECRLVMEQSFAHSSFSLVSPLRTYQDWLFAADLVPHYRHFGEVLRLIGSTSPDTPWVLKCPHHAPQVDSLLRAFPDARIVMMHRPIEDLVPSVARLAEAFLGMVEGPGIDMTSRAALIVDNIDFTLRRLLAVCAANPKRFFNLQMAEFVADPLGSAVRIHQHFALPLSDAALQAMTAWVSANGQRSTPAVPRELPYGLDRDALRERFSYYEG